MSQVMTGTVRKFDDAKGYGFIRADGVPEDIFVYQTAIKMEGYRTLASGDVVQFKVSRSEKGLKAEEVTKVSVTPPAAPEIGAI
jgi:CspA family cold shock protein